MKGKTMSLTLEGEKMVRRGALLGLQGKYDSAMSFVRVYQKDADTWGGADSWVLGNLKAWRETAAMAWVNLQVGKLELADFEARH